MEEWEGGRPSRTEGKVCGQEIEIRETGKKKWRSWRRKMDGDERIKEDENGKDEGD